MMNRIKIKHLSVLLILLPLFATVEARPPEPPLGFRWVLQDAFSDEFNGDQLNSEKWFDHYPGWEGRAPARFEPKALSLKNGNLEIQSGVLDKAKGPYTIYGGGIVSKSAQAHFGYYECRFKASKIAMSTTFWLSNDKVPFEPGDCPDDQYSQELDIQEAVGGGTTYAKFRNGMNCNTHYRYIKCGEKRETFISKGANATLRSEVSDEYHTYGAWWKDAEEVEFYADNEFFEMVRVSKEVSKLPFDRPMHINMVTETYDWQPPPSIEEITDETINTAYYDWVRAYKLVPVNEEFDHPLTGEEIFANDISLKNVSENIFDTDTLSLIYTYTAKDDLMIAFQIIEGNRPRTTEHEVTLTTLTGYGKAEYEIPISFDPIEGKNYRLQAQLINSSGHVFDEVRIDLSR